MSIEIETFADSQWGTNSYLVEDRDTQDAVIIDANSEPHAMIEAVKTRGAKLRAILLTHTDVDHIAGLPALLEAFGPVPVAVHPAEREVIAEGKPLRRVFPFALDRDLLLAKNVQFPLRVRLLVNFSTFR